MNQYKINNFSIIIPTRNRPNFLRRLLDYYNKYGKGFNIIVADASSNENKRLNKKTVSVSSNLNIQYLDNYSSEINMHYKILDALSYVNTKYSVLCADDDFITPNGVNKSIDFLEKNPDFTVAQGHYISFYLKNNKKFFWMPLLDHKSITFSEAKSRLVFYFSNYQLLTFYGVHKTKALKESFSELIKFTDGDIFSEILLVALNVIHGKIKCLDILYGARELMIKPESEKSKDFMDFIKEGTYDKKYTKFRECLSTHLSKKSKLTMEESKKLIDDAMPSCLKAVYKRHRGNLIIKITKFLNTQGSHFWVYKKTRELYRDLSFLKKVRTNPFWNLIDDPSSKYYNDFNKIRNHVLLYSKKQ